MDGGTACATPTCLLTIVEGPLVHSNRAIVRNAPRGSSRQPNGGTHNASSQQSHTESRLIDPAERVHCYCPENTTHLPPRVMAKRSSPGSKPWGKEMGYLRCASGAPLPDVLPAPSSLPAAAANGRSARGVVAGTNDEVATSAEHAVWPRGCGAVYAEAVAAKPHRCMPDRFFFSFADGELPSKGHDLIHLHDVLNRTEPTASARRLGVPPLLAITPSMLFGGGFTPQPPGEAGRIVGDPAAYYAGALTFKMLGT